MKKFICILLLTLLSSCSSEPDFAEMAGYFKDSNKGRAFAFVLPKAYTEQQVRDHAQSQMNTAGKMTVVFYYNSKHRAVNPTSMNTSLYNVTLALEKSDYLYRFDKYPNGSTYFGKKK